VLEGLCHTSQTAFAEVPDDFLFTKLPKIEISPLLFRGEILKGKLNKSSPMAQSLRFKK
jgi:hypothetical protein